MDEKPASFRAFRLQDVRTITGGILSRVPQSCKTGFSEQHAFGDVYFRTIGGVAN